MGNKRRDMQHDDYLDHIRSLIPEGSPLDPQVHGLLVEKIDSVARKAGIPKRYILESIRGVGTEADVAWVEQQRTLRKEDQVSWYIEGDSDPAIEVRMMALAGALLRNFLDARVKPATVLCSDDPDTDFTALLVPNFWVAGASMYSVAQATQVYNELMRRSAANRFTILYISDMQSFEDSQPWLARYIKGSFRSIDSLVQ